LYHIAGIKNLFILVATGDEQCMDWIRDCNKSESLEIVHIELNLIREKHVKKILEKTMIGDPTRNEQVSLETLYGIKSNKELKKVVRAVMLQTNGHPMSVYEMLENCKTCEQLETYTVVFREGTEDSEHWLRVMSKYQAGIKKLMEAVESGVEINMLEKVSDVGYELTLSQVAEKVHVRWEGKEIENAKVFASKRLKSLFGHLYRDFRDMLSKLVCDSLIFHEHSVYWEQFLLKRLQEAFNEGKSPGVVMARFFGKSTKFGSLETVTVPPSYMMIPKISDKGQGKYNDLYQRSLRTDLWNDLLADMAAHGFNCFVPHQMSSSSDSIILARGPASNDDSVHVWIGIAAKCVRDKLSSTLIKEEKRIFNRMFKGTARRAGELRILLIVSSGGFASRKIETGSYHYVEEDAKEFQHIDETILVDLSTREARAGFFGLTENDPNLDKIERIVSKN
jgi:hypothetical protein